MPGNQPETPPGWENIPPQANKPTEQQKLNGKTRHKEKGKVMFGPVEEEVDIETFTEPNGSGGYDVIVMLPFCPISSVTNQ